EKVVFSFSGDDDVWVFLDGTLSLDLGGIHGASDGSINFADNTITVNGTVVGQLFNVEDSEGNLISTGVLGVTRAYYSTQGEHTLKVFYLERGGSLSNCKIKFNLPVNDQLDVKKVVDTSSLVNPTTEELAAINSADYEFTLYFVDATTHAATAAASIDYLLYNSSNVFVGLKTTTAAGKFTLKNGYTARFPGQIDSYYYVTETQPTGKYSGVSWDVTWNGTTISGGSTAGNYTSPTSTNVSLLNKADYLKFTCTNALDPYYLTVSPETYVLDYGLPTIFDVLANDSQYGVGLILAGATGATNGTVEIVRLLANGKYEVVSAADLADEDNYEYRYIRYTPNTFLDSVDTITYTLITHEYNGTSYVAGSESSTATVIPATSVYYEEDFSDITYNNSKDTAGDDAADYSWNVSGTSEGLYQESGLVSETSGLNSPYGSDIAYINSVSKDTNGTSKTVTTSLNSVGGATANMTFTFTGTGAAIYMRTDTRSGMIRVYLYDSEGVEVGDSLTRQLYYAIDTVADPETGDTLYNIPVYNVSGLDYGTYTVTLVCLKYVANHTLFKNASDEALNTYYVDGIEILDPLGTELSQTVSDAYETDGENDATTVELRDKLLADETLVDTESGDLVWNENAFVLFTDTDGTAILAEDYKSNGPKNELYLQNGQSVTFTLSTWFQNNADGKRYDIYLGMKVPAGDTLNSNDVLEFWSGDTKLGEIALTSTADCYYDIKSFLVHNGYSGTVTIKAVTDEIISLTNIKITCETYDVIENG
ncbi:MAG TPA: hypothetical protein PLT66_03985, partial [Bacillota bacterium]|nr:hypothetical protein [Bacillota bacterium]